MIYKTLNDVFTNPLTNGIFTTLNTYDVPWKTDTQAIALNQQYHYNYSGQKITSPLIDNMLQNADALTDDNITSLCDTLIALYRQRWEKLWNTLNLEYDPISNYDMVESSEDKTTNGGNITEQITTEYGKTTTNESTGSNTGTVTENNTLTKGTIEDRAYNKNTGIYGFNGAESSPSDTETSTDKLTNSGTDTTENTVTNNLQSNNNSTITDSGTDTISNTKTDTTTRTETHTLTRSGNIGVTTSQQMIQSERDLWQWDFFQSVFSDIDTVLCSPIYLT